MDYFAGLDVSVKDTSICIVDDTGKIVREVKVASEPDALLQVTSFSTCDQANIKRKPIARINGSADCRPRTALAFAPGARSSAQRA